MLTLQETLDKRMFENTILSEGVEQDNMVEKFKSLEEVHKRLFPNGWQTVSYTDKFINIPSSMVMFRSTLKNTWSQGLKENDAQDTIFSIQHLGDDKYQAVLVKGRYIRTKKSFSSNQIPFRKVTGDAQKVIAKITEWEEKRRKLVDKIKDDLH